MSKSILMLLPNGFDPDPRVHTEARSLVQAGYNVTILAWDRELKYPKREVVDGIRIERFFVQSSYGRGSSQLVYLWRFWKEAYQRAVTLSPDVVHAHDFNTLPLGYWIGRKLKKPVIFDAHESYHEMLSDNVHPLIKLAISKAERYFVKRVDLLITVGSIIEKEYQKRGAKKTVIVGNWKRLEDFQFSEDELEEARKRYGIPDDRLVVSYIGYFDYTRGIIPLLDAVRSSGEVFLILGGKGMLEKEVSTAVKNQQNILYLGYTSPDRIPILTMLSDVIYYGLEGDCGNNRYSAPNKLFEALVAGKSVITGNIGEISHIVKEEECGICLERITQSDLMLAFKKLNNKSLLSGFQKNSRKAGERKYNWKMAEKALLNAYQEVLSS